MLLSERLLNCQEQNKSPRGHTFEELLHPKDEEGVVSLNTGGASS